MLYRLQLHSQQPSSQAVFIFLQLCVPETNVNDMLGEHPPISHKDTTMGPDHSSGVMDTSEVHRMSPQSREVNNEQD